MLKAFEIKLRLLMLACTGGVADARRSAHRNLTLESCSLGRTCIPADPGQVGNVNGAEFESVQRTIEGRCRKRKFSGGY